MDGAPFDPRGRDADRIVRRVAAGEPFDGDRPIPAAWLRGLIAQV